MSSIKKRRGNKGSSPDPTESKRGKTEGGEQVTIDAVELERLRDAAARWEAIASDASRQSDLIVRVEEQGRVVEQAHRQLEVQLKSELAHYKAAVEEAEGGRKRAEETLVLLEALTNVKMREEEGRGHLCEARDRHGHVALSFYLKLQPQGDLEYVPVSQAAKDIPSFFRESIEFSKGQACVFFREVLKVLTRE